jgi:hypothetical protein
VASGSRVPTRVLAQAPSAVLVRVELSEALRRGDSPVLAVVSVVGVALAEEAGSVAADAVLAEEVACAEEVADGIDAAPHN